MAGTSAGAVARPLRMLRDIGVLVGFSDGQLLDRFTTGPSDSAELAFQTLVERHGPMVLAVCRQVLVDPNDAEDAFQATFLILFRRAGTIRNRAGLSGWLYGVAMRIAARAKSGRLAAAGSRHNASGRCSGRITALIGKKSRPSSTKSSPSCRRNTGRRSSSATSRVSRTKERPISLAGQSARSAVVCRGGATSYGRD